MRLMTPLLLVGLAMGPLACATLDDRGPSAEYPSDAGSRYAERLREGKDADGSLPKPKQTPAEVKSNPKAPVIPEKTQ